MQKLEETLRDELNMILEQEETFWCKKFQVTWLKEGEQNTKFFYTSTLIRERRNQITRLKINGDSWCEDQNLLKTAARDFYVQLYS